MWHRRDVAAAVILAAGSGHRISAVTAGCPKPLLPIDGKIGSITFLDWHLRCLSQAGVRRICVVGNKAIYGWQSDKADVPRIEWILNPTSDLSTSGSGHSASFAWEPAHGILDGKSRVILMDADIVYDPALLTRLIDAAGDDSKILVCGQFRDTDEEVLVFGAHGRPRRQGKGLLATPLVEGLECMGEATGILLWEPRDHEVLRAASEWSLAYSTAKLRTEHEDITQHLMLMDRMQAVTLEQEMFMEVDTPDEYAVLVDTFYPELAARLRRPW
jgi:choline kinase